MRGTTIDPVLLEAAKRGDTPSLDRLLVACRPDVRRYAMRHCFSADVDDAVQESLLLLTRYLPSLRSTRAFSVWIFQIVRRECLRLVGKSRYSRVSLDSLDEDRYLAVRDDLELRIDLLASIQSLPDLYREIIILRDLEELTIREIGDRLGLPSGTVKTRIHRGRVLIREYLLA